MDFTEKVVWITGTSSGIGEALAHEFSSRGARLILSSNEDLELQRTARDLGRDQQDVFPLPLDLSDVDGLEGVAGRALERFGRIDVLVNNGGISQRSLVKDTGLSTYRRIMNIDFLGHVAVTLAVLPSMLERRSGHIVVTSSISGKVGSMPEVFSLTPEKLAIVSCCILFDRRVPPESYPLAALGRLDVSGLRLKKVGQRSMHRLDMFELGSLLLGPGRVEDSTDILYRGHDIRARVCAARFSSPEEVEAFWDRLRENYELRSSHSVYNGLGDGAHWIFRHRWTGYCFWLSDRTFMAVMVRHDDTSPEDDEWARVEELRKRIIEVMQAAYAPDEKQN